MVMVDVARSGGGDPAPDDAGFREWMIVRASTLRRKAFLLCGDWASADDLVQDVLVAMYPRWSRIVRGGHVDAYANRVLVGKHVDARRRPWRRERSFDTVPDSVDSASEGAIAAVEEGDGPLVAALAALPAGQRAVLVLRFTDDLSVEGIAQVMGIPAGTVKSRLSRGIESLRAHLDASSDLAARVPPLEPDPAFVPVTEDRS
ncbi:SigE family RNA polymerase sigma factor [Nocardioides cavernae]|uniref:SigE family RNA polymerase sigma factor n=1 Tax=Nocardioides cavernae TaxID=1921566 RepID=A0ABR8NA89_9ACTN|nr:SigE family RNA polymerase sigma factor [Nocardioides cavernae]MBD3925058.1 SigE family RNA polymerase sigma factor [Nocardioides cavernae]MBM7514568.1 RNA polymerase sigma-70 factor (sigma-E family) [Nocardioides cavernae]